MVTDRFQGTALSNLSLSVPDTKGRPGDPLSLKQPAQFGPSSQAPPADPAPGPSSPSSSAAPTSSAPPSPSSAPPAPPAPAPSSEAAKPAPVPSKAPEPRSQNSSLAGQVIDIVNQERAKEGCAPVSDESHLAAAAQGHSDDMSARNYFSHTTPEGVTFDQRIRNAGYSKPGAENIAKGQNTAAEVMEAWMNSAGHRANILNCSLKKIGVGVATNGWYWTQNFGY